MMAERKFVTSLLVLALLLFTEACNKKKPVLPPKSLAPTIAVALPNEIPEKPETRVPEVAQTPVEPPVPKTKPKKTTTAKKTAPVNPPPAPTPAPAPAPAPAPVNNNNATVASLHPPSSEIAAETAIAAAIPSAEMKGKKDKTEQMIAATENNLKSLSRSLSDEEKAMKTQIQSLLLQSRKATSEGDFERAYNLAEKAQLLAEALSKK